MVKTLELLIKNAKWHYLSIFDLGWVGQTLKFLFNYFPRAETRFYIRAGLRGEVVLYVVQLSPAVIPTEICQDSTRIHLH